MVFIFLERAVGQLVITGQLLRMAAMPEASVLPRQRIFPAVPNGDIRAFYRLRFVQVVTQTSEDSRPFLKWAARLVRSAVV